MSHCLNPNCPDPTNQKSPDQGRAKFCSNCGASLRLGDRYRAVKLIGQGTTSRTFLGIDEHRPSQPQCVIKQRWQRQDEVHPTDTSTASATSAQFRQDAMRLEQLGKHPQIPTLWAFFEQHSYRYLIQEFINGVNLETQLQAHGPLMEPHIRGVLNQLLPILQYVHSQHIIHGNIKAQNIIRASTQTAKSLTHESANSETNTQDSLFLVDFGATPFNGLFSRDFYDLGLTCIHLLTGTAPPIPLGAAVQPWLSHLKQPISEGLAQVLHKMVQLDGGDRYTSAQEVLDDLHQALDPRLSAIGVHAVSPEENRPTFIPPPSRPANPSVAAPPPSSERQPQSPERWQCVQTLRGHQSWVRSIALSADGQWLISGSGDKTVNIWSVPQGQLRHTLTGHTTWVRGVALSPDQRLIASVSNDKTIRLWHLQTGEYDYTLKGHTDWIRAVLFFPSGSFLATAGQDKLIHLWNLKRHCLVGTLQGHEHWVLALACHPDGQRLFSASRDRTIRCWTVATGQCQRMLLGHTSEVLALAISPDGHYLASGSADQTIRLWDHETGRLLKTLRGHQGAVNSVVFHPNGQTLASGSSDKTIKLWDLKTGTLCDTLNSHGGWVWTLDFSTRLDLSTRAGSPTQPITLASGSWDGLIHIWQQLPQSLPRRVDC